MDVRKLTDPKDWLESERVIETAFLHPWDEAEARERIQAQANGSLPRPEVSWGLFDGDTMLTSISTLQHQLSFGGEVIYAGEFHMVGSLPERRGGGGVRRLFGEILRDFRAQGDVLAVLIPFSCAFYRKFGFEVATLVMDQRVAIDQLAGFSCDLRVTRVWNEADLAPVRALWDAHARSCNLAEVRDDAAWAWHGNGDYGAPDFLHPDRQRYTYVLWDTKDNPCSYLRFSFFHQPDLPFVGELKVDDFVWNSPLALRSALGFLYRMRAKVSHINFELPDLDLSTLMRVGRLPSRQAVRRPSNRPTESLTSSWMRRRQHSSYSDVLRSETRSTVPMCSSLVTPRCSLTPSRVVRCTSRLANLAALLPRQGAE